jgi:hypothetical protein
MGFEPLDCAEDAEAIAQARQLVDNYHAMELWSGARLVERIGEKESREVASHEIDDRCTVPKHE